MGKISNYKIAFKALGAGVYDYAFDVDNEFFSFFEGSEITGGDCGVEVQLHRSESMLEMNISIDGEVEVPCDRCLEPCLVDVFFEGRLIVKFSSEIDDYDGEVMWLSPSESEVDLSQYIYESIVLSLPYQRVHAEGECNAEMIAKFKTISKEALMAMEALAEEQEPNEDEDSEESESVGLAQSELEKLQALKAMMTKEE